LFVSDEESEVEKLKPFYCSNCNEANIKNAEWCSKCGMILSFSGYQEAVKEQKHKDEKINLIEKQLESQSTQLKALISALGNINDQSQVNNMAQTQLWHFECIIVIKRWKQEMNLILTIHELKLMNVWCPYYWDCMALISREKNNIPNDSRGGY
jgi:hypothetical protein